MSREPIPETGKGIAAQLENTDDIRELTHIHQPHRCSF